MTLLASKWLLVPGTLIIIIGLLYALGKKSVHSEETVSASPEQVWSVLMDTENYDQWNEVLVPLEGNLRVNNKIKYHFQQDVDNAYVIKSTVRQIVENRLLNQGGGIPGVLTFDHRYVLEPLPQGTKVIIHEEYRGIGVHFWDPAPVEASYERLIKALKKRVSEVFRDE